MTSQKELRFFSAARGFKQQCKQNYLAANKQKGIVNIPLLDCIASLASFWEGFCFSFTFSLGDLEEQIKALKLPQLRMAAVLTVCCYKCQQCPHPHGWLCPSLSQTSQGWILLESFLEMQGCTCSAINSRGRFSVVAVLASVKCVNPYVPPKLVCYLDKIQLKLSQHPSNFWVVFPFSSFFFFLLTGT